MISKHSQATRADAGIVNTHAHNISGQPPAHRFQALHGANSLDRAGDHMRGGDRLFTAVATRIDNAAPVYAQYPPRGLNLVSRVPMVRTIRHPPLMVPNPMTACAERITHMGTLNVAR